MIAERVPGVDTDTARVTQAARSELAGLPGACQRLRFGI